MTAPAHRLARIFLLRVALFAAVAHVACIGLAAWLFDSPIIGRVGYSGAEIYLALQKAARPLPPGTRAVVLGDSVANQIYYVSARESSVRSLASNQAVELPGQYVILRRFLESQPPGTVLPSIFLVVVPWTLESNLDQPFTFHYALKPLDRAPYRDWLDPRTLASLRSLPGAGWAAWPEVRLSAWSPSRPPPPSAENGTAWLYVDRMIELCRSHGATLQMICPPLRESRRAAAAALFERWTQEARAPRLLPGYRASLRTRPDTEFVDGVHYLDPMKLGPDPLGLVRSLVTVPRGSR